MKLIFKSSRYRFVLETAVNITPTHCGWKCFPRPCRGRLPRPGPQRHLGPPLLSKFFLQVNHTCLAPPRCPVRLDFHYSKLGRLGTVICHNSKETLGGDTQTWGVLQLPGPRRCCLSRCCSNISDCLAVPGMLTVWRAIFCLANLLFLYLPHGDTLPL